MPYSCARMAIVGVKGLNEMLPVVVIGDEFGQECDDAIKHFAHVIYCALVSGTRKYSVRYEGIFNLC